MVDYLSKDIVYVSSKNRLQGTSSNFTINLTSQIRNPNQYDRLSLLSFSCPKSYYLINSTNNIFTVNENGVITTITLPVGNYSYTTMTTQLATSLAGLTNSYTITNSYLTGKFRFVATPAAVQPIFTFGTNSPYAVLGFDISSTNTFTAGALVSTNVVNFQLTNTIQLMSNIVDKNLLATIIPDNVDFSTLSYNEVNSIFASKQLVGTNITNANFYLIDGITGQVLDLNGLDFAFKFVIYKQNDYYRTLLNDKKIKALEKALDEEIPTEP